MNKKTLVVLDDNIDLADYLCELAEMLEFDTTKYYSSKKFVKEFNISPNVIILDLMIPEMDGIEVMKFLSQRDSTSSLILISGIDSVMLNVAEEFAKANNLHLFGTLSKPFRSKEIKALLEKI